MSLTYPWQQTILDAYSSPAEFLSSKIDIADREIATRLSEPPPPGAVERMALRDALTSLRVLRRMSPSYMRCLTDKLNRTMIHTVMVDLDLALTFAALAENCRDVQNRVRNYESAFHASQTIRRHIMRLTLNDSELAHVFSKLGELEHRLGEFRKTAPAPGPVSDPPGPVLVR